MKLLAQLLSRLARLPRPSHPDLGVDRDLVVPMSDGSTLLADRWFPLDLPDAPIVLARSPYGRRQLLETLGQVIAAQGYQVVIQSVRGTFGSGETWRPFFNEQADGQATLTWLAAQPWFVPRVATFGPSYLGLTQWSIAENPPEWLRGMAISVSSTGFRDAVIHPGDAFGLDLAMSWIHGLEFQERSFLTRAKVNRTAEDVMARSAALLPVGAADRSLVGRSVDYYQEWVEHEMPGDPFWVPIDFAAAVATAPSMSLLAGWYDIFSPQQFDDYAALVAAGRPARITVGPWHHSEPAGMLRMIRDGVDHFRAVLDRGGEHTGDPVRLYVMGRDRWRTFPSWPPPPTERRRLRLGPSGTLTGSETLGTANFRYDPADPTPAVGGRALNGKHAGRKDQRERESRADVVVFNTEPLTRDTTVIGLVTVDLTLRISGPAADLFVRLCDVDRRGRSINICDAGVRLRPEQLTPGPDGTVAITLTLAPTANTFRRGHRIRLQVSAGAHPLMSRNPGPGRRLQTGVPTETVDYSVILGPSAVNLPIVG